MAACKICKSDASLGHCICLLCLADWSRMRLAVAEYVNHVFDSEEFNRFKVPTKEAFKNISGKYKKDPLFVRSLIEWKEPWPAWESNRCYQALIRKEGEEPGATSKSVTEGMDYLRELYFTNRELYNEQIQEIEFNYGEN